MKSGDETMVVWTVMSLGVRVRPNRVHSRLYNRRDVDTPHLEFQLPGIDPRDVQQRLHQSRLGTCIPLDDL